MHYLAGLWRASLPVNSKNIPSILRQIGAAPSKRRGQNFLLSDATSQIVIDRINPENYESVVEVGPGLGALTEPLLKKSKRFIAIELDRALSKYLKKTYNFISSDNSQLLDLAVFDENRAVLIEKDVLEIDPENLFPESCRPSLLVSNVPYSISSPFILWIIKHRKYFSDVHLLFQREFAERLVAPEGSKTRGSLGVLTQLFADVKLGKCLSGDSFYPPADVESRFVELTFPSSNNYGDVDEKLFEEVVRASFATRRKTLLNCLAGSGKFGSKEEILHVIESCGGRVLPGVRAEMLSVEDFVVLCGKLR